MLLRLAVIVPALAVTFAASLALLVAEERAPVAPIIAEARPTPGGPRLAEPEEPVAAIMPPAFAAPAPARRSAAAARAVRVVSPAPDRAATVAVIEAAAREFGQDPTLMVSVAMCESRLNPAAVGQAGEIGIYQFLGRTFERNAKRLRYKPADIWDVTAQSRVAAEMFSRGQSWQWTCARLRADRSGER